MGRDRMLLWATGGVLLASTVAIGLLESPHAHIHRFLALYAIAFAAYLVASRTVLSMSECTFGVPILIVAVCALAHAAVIPARPVLSTDIFRYAWEGRIVLEGGNPFASAPDDTVFAGLRDADYAHINHQRLPTIYPPLAQGVFALATLAHPGPLALKIIFSLFNLATVLVLFKWLRRRGRPEAHALVFAWNPLVIVETGHSGHVDALAVFLLVLALYLWQSERRVWAGVVLGASILAKYLAAVLVPWFVRRRYAAVLIATAVVVAAGYAPFLDAGTRLFSSLRVYSENWSFNGPPFLLLRIFLDDAVIARRLLLAGGIAFALVAAHRERDIARYAFLVIGCALVVSPTVYPWYMIWIMPLLCLFPSRPWIIFSGLVMLSYGVWSVYHQSGQWLIPQWMLVFEYVPFYLLLLHGLARSSRRAWAPA